MKYKLSSVIKEQQELVDAVLDTVSPGIAYPFLKEDMERPDFINYARLMDGFEYASEEEKEKDKQRIKEDFERDLAALEKHWLLSEVDIDVFGVLLTPTDGILEEIKKYNVSGDSRSNELLAWKKDDTFVLVSEILQMAPNHVLVMHLPSSKSYIMHSWEFEIQRPEDSSITVRI